MTRPRWRWRCIVWPATRLLLWVVALIVITVMNSVGLELPTTIGVVIGSLFVSRELYRWIFRGEAPREVPGTA